MLAKCFHFRKFLRKLANITSVVGKIRKGKMRMCTYASMSL